MRTNTLLQRQKSCSSKAICGVVANDEEGQMLIEFNCSVLHYCINQQQKKTQVNEATRKGQSY